MNEFDELRALITTFEELVKRHPYLEDEVQSIYQEEILSLRLKSLRKQLSNKT
jgi:hypothetical protein